LVKIDWVAGCAPVVPLDMGLQGEGFVLLIALNVCVAHQLDGFVLVLQARILSIASDTVSTDHSTLRERIVIF
jgi:hypothetical protein